MTTLLSGTVCLRRLGLAMINLHNKFEVSVFTDYEGIKGNGKCRNWDGLGVGSRPRSLAMSPFYRVHTTSYSTLINHASILYLFSN